MRVGLVVGGAGGIGAACACALARSADAVALVGRNLSALEQVAAELGPASIVIGADIADEQGREAIFERLRVADMPLAWVVLASGMPLRGTLLELEPRAIEAAFAANVIGPILLVRRLLSLDWADPASIVIIGSISATRPLPRRSVYAATKAGLERFGQAVAGDVASVGIRVNVVSAGVIDTPFLDDDRRSVEDWARARVPEGRLGSPAEVAELVRYLIVGAPEYLTGSRIVIDGGTEAVT